MASIKDDNTMVQVTRITRKAEPSENGRHTQICYYCGERKVAQEFYDTDGNIIQGLGVIPDAIVKEYYRRYIEGSHVIPGRES